MTVPPLRDCTLELVVSHCKQRSSTTRCESAARRALRERALRPALGEPARLIREHDFNAAILLAPLSGVVVRHREPLSTAEHFEASRRNATAHELVGYGLRAPL